LGITINNIRVAFLAFAFGVITSIGTAYILFSNGVMLGAFITFFYTKGVFFEANKQIWLHGTIEISVIIVAGCAGLIMGNSILFPNTFLLRVISHIIKQNTWQTITFHFELIVTLEILLLHTLIFLSKT